MYYYRLLAETPYVGTEAEEYIVSSAPYSEAELNEMADDFCRHNAEGYEYLVSGWDDENFEDMTEEEREEEINNYYADCYGTWEEITKEQYEENA